MITAYIFIITKPGGRIDLTPAVLMKLKEVKDVTEVYGEYDVVIKVQVKEMADLKKLIQQIRELGGVDKTTTMISVS